MTVDQIRHRFIFLTALRWLPTGLTVPALVLIGQARGLSLGQIGITAAIYGATTMALELPTGGFSDVAGRRPVLVAAAVMSVVACIVTAFGTSFAVLAVAAAIRGAARALDSGPLQAWYVDQTRTIDTGAPIRGGLSQAAASESVALAIGTLGAGAVLALSPLPPSDSALIALSTPFLVAAGAAVAQAALVVAWVTDPPRSTRLGIRDVMREVPSTMTSGVRLAATHALLRRLLVVIAAVGVALAGIELLMPAHLAEVLGSRQKAGTAYALLATLGFAGSALGSAMAPLATRLVKSPSRAALLGSLGAAVALAVSGFSALGAIAAAYVAFYVLLGIGSPLIDELTHDAVTSRERATMLSVNSMALQLAGIGVGLTLGLLTHIVSPGAALAAPALILAAGALALVRLPHGMRSADAPAG
ncbi:MFS transporter [Demequina sp. TTPB684]|uniref:MFS transporter n=1 Tax=unclassified Demequina TaxID=2620311 RepID=UPI001CF477C4|nr:MULTISPECIES: MFS transporter [unclassified Demequina]MCB2414067.1 MFS transporter [Demequina sp. TTPB684]UPU89222.1 MFS transporter [Demequina sp. TMPB413]